MRCPFCGHPEDKVVDSRESREGDAIRRRRECLRCGRRFTSYERLEEVPVLVLKKDGRREPFDPAKLKRSLLLACQKRPVPQQRLDEVVTDIQARLMEHPDREIPSLEVGELVMRSLKGLDSVAYVRFASVYRDFKDLPEFVEALEALMKKDQREGEAALPPAGFTPPQALRVAPSPKSVAVPSAPPLFPAESVVPLPSRKRR
ncbi:MAG: transcriptional repressor NrdR [Holophagaceae bacterium]|nr:transcriptional repressor NrdR [Holophagaceae bacterium]